MVLQEAMPIIKKEVNVDKQVHDLLSSPFSPRSGGETRSVLQVSFSQGNFGTHTNVSLLPYYCLFPPQGGLNWATQSSFPNYCLFLLHFPHYNVNILMCESYYLGNQKCCLCGFSLDWNLNSTWLKSLLRSKNKKHPSFTCLIPWFCLCPDIT